MANRYIRDYIIDERCFGILSRSIARYSIIINIIITL